MAGWISIYRSIWNNWVWQEKPFSKGQAWVDLLLLMGHEDGKVVFRQEVIPVKRGQKVTSELKLSERWGWSRNKVRAYLERLKQDNMIDIKKDKRKTIITIVNYDDYQGEKKRKVQQKVQQIEQQEVQQEVQQSDINNKDNKDNKYIIYGELGNVKLKDGQYEKLVQDHGQVVIDDFIQRIDYYVASKGRKYKDYYATVKAWIRREEKKEKEKGRGKMGFGDFTQRDYSEKELEELIDNK
jgi:predicted transcriptional regulator